MSERLDDFRWLLTESAGRWLDQTVARQDAGDDVLLLNKALRKHLEPERVALILELVRLRRKARRKFDNADQMFFTRRALEMATDSRIAAYKAKRFKKMRRIADVCCGIGGDLIALSKASPTANVTGFDSDPLSVMYAIANLKASGIAEPDVRESTFDAILLDEFDAIHIDPERRKHGRSSQGKLFSPSLTSICRKAANCPGIGIKVAPATQCADEFPEAIERQWIGHSRECKQQMIWCGRLARHPDCRMATRLGKSGGVAEFSFPEAKIASSRPAIASQFETYVYEPHNVLLASSLADAMATELNLEKIAPNICYYTSDTRISNKLWARFKVAQVMPANLKKVAQAVQQTGFGELEIKKRGVPDFVVDNYKRIKLKGAGRATLLLTQFKQQRLAIIATREKTR